MYNDLFFNLSGFDRKETSIKRPSTKRSDPLLHQDHINDKIQKYSSQPYHI